MKVRGRLLLLGSLICALGVGLAIFLILRKSTAGRFSIEVYSQSTVPEKKPPIRLGFVNLQDKKTFSPIEPLIVRIEGKHAGKTNMKAMAFLLSDEGDIIDFPQLLQKQEILIKGDVQQVEQAMFAPVGFFYERKTLVMVVIRLPEEKFASFVKFDEKTKPAALKKGPLSAQQAKDRLEDKIAKMKILAASLLGHTDTQELPIFLSHSLKTTDVNAH